MSKEDLKDTAKKIAVIIIAAIIIQAGTALYQTYITKRDVRQNTKDIERLEMERSTYVLKNDNNAAHEAILKSAEKNAEAIREITKQMGDDQKYIMDKLENINNNVLQIYQTTK